MIDLALVQHVLQVSIQITFTYIYKGYKCDYPGYEFKKVSCTSINSAYSYSWTGTNNCIVCPGGIFFKC